MTRALVGKSDSLVEITAVVVNHNAGTALLGCVKSLHGSGISQIIVVDNASSDGSLEALAKSDSSVELVATGKNLGYGSAANIGVRHADGQYVLICNPDLVIDADTPAHLGSVLDGQSDVALVGPRIVEPNGAVYPSARAFPQLFDAVGHAFVGLFRPHNRWSDRYRFDAGEIDTNTDIDWVSGACVLVRKIAFQSIGGFDEHYFMYVEDLDLCWRLRRGGWRTQYIPGAAVMHEQGGSSGRHPLRLLIAHHRSTWRFVCKSTEGPKRLLLPVIGLGIFARLVLALGNAVRSK